MKMDGRKWWSILKHEFFVLGPTFQLRKAIGIGTLFFNWETFAANFFTAANNNYR